MSQGASPPTVDIETLLGALQAASSKWRNAKGSGAPAQIQASYLHVLVELQKAVLALPPQRAAQLLVGRNLAERILQTAIEHAAQGVLPRVSMQVWLQILRTTLDVVRAERHSLSHVALRQWESVRKMSRDHYQRTYSAAAVCASLHLLRLLLKYCPIELRGAARKDLPHPLKNSSLPVRVGGFQLVPLVVANVSQPSPPSQPASAAAAANALGPRAVLSSDFYEYLRKGLVSAEYAVREAAVEAVRRILELNVGIDAYTGPLLLEHLVSVCQDNAFPSVRLETDAGVAVGLLLRLYQTGAVNATSASPTAPAAMWTFFGGRTAAEAARTARCLLRPTMSRTMQRMLSTAVATFLTRCCPTPAALGPALRAAFVLLVPVEGDSREYMPRLLADALAEYAAQQPSNLHRTALILCLRDYVQRIQEARTIPHTALIAIELIVPMLAASREACSMLEADMMAAFHAQPGTFLGVVSTIAGIMALRDPFYQHRLLNTLIGSVCQPAGSSAAAARPKDGVKGFSRDALFAMKAVLASAHASAPASLDSSYRMPLLAVVAHLSVDEAGDGAGAAAGREEALYQRAEYFYLTAAALLSAFPTGVSAFMSERIVLTANRFATTLVCAPSQSAACYRAMCAACAFFRVSKTTTMQDNLCIGFLESQQLGQPSGADGDAADEPVNTNLQRLKGEVYRVVASSSWASCNDEGSLKWLVTQALNDVQAACDSGTPATVEVEELFPAAVAPFMRGSMLILPTAAQSVAAETAKHAAWLVGHGVVELARVNRSFCIDVLRRVQSLLKSVDAALVAAVPGDRSGGSRGGLGTGTAADSARLGKSVRQVWSALALLNAIVGSAVRSSVPAREWWGADFREETLAWERTVQQWLALSSYFDLQVLGARVLGGLWCLQEAVDSHTTRIVVAQQPSASSSDDAVRTAVLSCLPLAEAHACCRVLYGNDAASPTLPMIISFVSNLTKRCTLLGDPCSPHAMSILLSYIVLAQSYPAEVMGDSVPVLLLTFLLPDPPAIDPLVQSLCLGLFAVLSDVCGAAPSSGLAAAPVSAPASVPNPSVQRMVSDNEWIAVRRVLTSQRPPCQPQTEAAEMDLVRILVRHCDAAALTPTAVLQPHLAGLLQTRAGDEKVPLPATAPLLPPRPTLPAAVSAALAALVQECINVSAVPVGTARAPGWPGGCGIVEVAMFIDQASSPVARAAWRAVARQLLQQAAAANTVAGFVRALQVILQARSPDLGDQRALQAGSTMEAETKGSGAAANTDAGEVMEEGQQNMLGGADERDRAARGGTSDRRHGGVAGSATLTCAWSDGTAKRAALRLLVEAVELGWGDMASDGEDATGVRAAVMDALVVAVPLAAATPELLPPAMDLLQAVLSRLAASGAQAVRPWRTALVASVKAVLELAAFNTGRACELLTCFLACPLADDSSAKRVARSLVILLAAIERLHGEESRSALAATRQVATALCRLLCAAAARTPTGELRWPATAAAAAECVRSNYGQSALAALCRNVVCLAAIATGFEPPAGFDDGRGSSAESGDGAESILFTAAFAWSTDAGDGSLGPSLRHVLGCLCCLVAATNGADVVPLPPLVPLLSWAHQRILVRIAYRSLVDEGPAPCAAETVRALISIIAGSASVDESSSDMVEDLVSVLLSREQSSAPGTSVLSVPEAGDLLCTLLRARSGQTELMAHLLRQLVVDYIRLAPERLLEAAADALVPLSPSLASPRLLEELANVNECGMLLCERAWVYAVDRQTAALAADTEEVPNAHDGASEKDAAAAAARVASLLRRANSPLRAAQLTSRTAEQLMRSIGLTDDPQGLCATFLLHGGRATLRVPALRTANLRLQSRLILVIGSAAYVDGAIRHASLLCWLFIELMRAAGLPTPESPGHAPESMCIAVQLLVELLDTDRDGGTLGKAYYVALQPVGLYLVQTVAKQHAQALKAAIQALSPSKVSLLRAFMQEASATASPFTRV